MEAEAQELFDLHPDETDITVQCHPVQGMELLEKTNAVSLRT